MVCVLDDKRNQLISGGKDGTLIVWTADGQVILILFYSAIA
jgi:WD40 repeat protein